VPLPNPGRFQVRNLQSVHTYYVVKVWTCNSSYYVVQVRNLQWLIFRIATSELEMAHFMNCKFGICNGSYYEVLAQNLQCLLFWIATSSVCDI
jgi:hypothetical protein